MNKINFMGEDLYTPEELANSFKEHYSEAVDAILYNPKTIVKFIKKSNKKLAKEIDQMFNETEHSDNALAFFIYMVLEEQVVYLRGRAYKFREFMLAYVAFKDKVDNEYADFINDKGLSRTFAKMDPTFKDDAYYIEQNFDTKLAKNYLLSYFEKDIKQVFYARLQAIAISDDEAFRQASKLINNEDFYLYIARRYGFTKACLLAGERNSLFDAIKLYKKEIDNDLLIRLVTDTFYWWLAANLDKYDYEGEAKWIPEKIEEAKKEYDEQRKLLQNHKIQALDLDFVADVSKKLYLYYFTFVDYYKAGTIKPKDPATASKYALDKNYCDTLICSAYIAKHAVKLEQKSSEEEAVDDTEFTISYKDITKIVYGYRRQTRYSGLILTITLLMILTGVFLSFGTTLVASDFGKALLASQKVFEGLPWMLVFVLSLLTASILSFIVYIRTFKSKKALHDYVKLRDISYKEYVTCDDDEVYFHKRFYLSDIKKDALMTSRILSSCALGFFSVALTVIALCGVSVLSYYMPTLVDFNKAFVNNNLSFLYFLASFAVGFGIGMIRKYKNIFTLLGIIILVIAVVFGLTFAF